jgi:hypothetical protein
VRINKTEKNYKTIWQQLDNASGELYNALDNLARMVDIPEDLKRQADMIDITRIDCLKQEIEELMEKKVHEKTVGQEINERLKTMK